jgi:hypothetical protein
MDNLCIHVPLNLKRRGGRKLIILPQDAAMAHASSPQNRFDETLMNGIAKAWRWQALYERGKYSSLDAFAERHRLNKSYAARIMRLNLLAPDIRLQIMEGRQPKGMKLADLMDAFPPLWEEQRKIFGFAPDTPPVASVCKIAGR